MKENKTFEEGLEARLFAIIDGYYSDQAEHLLDDIKKEFSKYKKEINGYTQYYQSYTKYPEVNDESS